MALFNKSLQAVATLETVLLAAYETFNTEKKKVLETLKNPTPEIGKMRDVLTQTEANAKKLFAETVRADFAAVREAVQKVTTAAPPADFPATLAAVNAAGKDISDHEAAALLEKYKGNYLAFRSLHAVLKKEGRDLPHLIYPDAVMGEIDAGEKMVLDVGQNWKGATYMSALLQAKSNPITALADHVQKFIDGRYSLEEDGAGE